MSAELFRLTIPGIGPTSNQFYAGMHHMARHKLVKQWHRDVFYACKAAKIPRITTYPVMLAIVACFGPTHKRYDADNVYGTAKLVLDGLVHSEVLQNDAPRCVAEVRLLSRKTSEPDHTLVICWPYEAWLC